MTRHMGFVIIMAAIMALWGLSAGELAQASEHQWTSLDGPYWANGIDVAYGMSGLGEDWHRYLIGSDGNVKKLHYWGELNPRWQEWDELPGANKLISYRNSGSGHYAVCSAYDDDIYRTINGGADWNGLEFPETFNRHFSSVEIVNWTQNPGQIILVGSGFQDGFASAYYTDNSGDNWYKLGASTDPLDDLHVHDIETFPEIADPPHVAAGTSSGIYLKIGDAWGDSWQPVNFQGSDVPALETIDGWDTGQQLAAVEEGPEGRCNLYYSNPQGDTRWESPVEITPNGESFGRRVRDLSAIYWGNYYISCYAATDEGLFLITYSDPAQATYYDLDYSPLLYDIDVQSLDYRFLDLDNEDDTAYVMVTTNYNVYEIKETRNSNHQITYTSVSEIVTGTYMCNVVGASFPENTEDSQKILTVSEEALVKKYDNGAWVLTGFAFTGSGKGRIGNDIAADFNGPNQDYVLVSSNTEYVGTIMYSSDAGNTWEDRSPNGHPKNNSVDLELGSGQDANDAYAAGFENVWCSSDNGFNWDTHFFFSNLGFNDIIADPDRWSSPYKAYVASSGEPKVSAFTGTEWFPIDNGLEGVAEVYELAKNNLSGLIIYAATSDGIYKYREGGWLPRQNGTGVVNIGTIANDAEDPLIGFLSATSSGAGGGIWASCDSARSWKGVNMGDINPTIQIHKISASEDGVDPLSGFAVGTGEGIYLLGDIVKHGIYIDEDEVWGPGTIMVAARTYSEMRS